MAKFNDALSLSPTDARAAYEDIGGRVNETLANLGVVLEGSTPPSANGQPYDGSLPPNLDELSYDALSELMRANTEWSRYLQGHHTSITNDKRIAQQQLDAVKSAIIHQRGKDHLMCDVRYVEINVQVTELECLEAAFDAAIQNAKDVYRMLSRAVTIRGQDQERVTRSENLERGFVISTNGRRRHG